MQLILFLTDQRADNFWLTAVKTKPWVGAKVTPAVRIQTIHMWEDTAGMKSKKMI